MFNFKKKSIICRLSTSITLDLCTGFIFFLSFLRCYLSKCWCIPLKSTTIDLHVCVPHRKFWPIFYFISFCFLAPAPSLVGYHLLIRCRKPGWTLWMEWSHVDSWATVVVEYISGSSNMLKMVISFFPQLSFLPLISSFYWRLVPIGFGCTNLLCLWLFSFLSFFFIPLLNFGSFIFHFVSLVPRGKNFSFILFFVRSWIPFLMVHPLAPTLFCFFFYTNLKVSLTFPHSYFSPPLLLSPFLTTPAWGLSPVLLSFHNLIISSSRSGILVVVSAVRSFNFFFGLFPALFHRRFCRFV